MKAVYITDKVYEQLEALAVEHDEMIEVMACVYLERGMGELARMEAKAEESNKRAEFSEAMLENTQPMRRH